ncbi:hypothetical protein KXD96_24335 [Mycobacterium sp. SMC-2]|uniref:hypothetical protein n=1 Tax=Mycobacterium sp. SMC-2 TaxID=2857058 RepID=UPI0021B1A289|nr:hypothetical protein [Mycobacterium sp. SMC-2]UXA09617.1 hypothetical protein KXD96_24335 [Mycobacterium sp. SMC-2]
MIRDTPELVPLFTGVIIDPGQGFGAGAIGQRETAHPTFSATCEIDRPSLITANTA